MPHIPAINDIPDWMLDQRESAPSSQQMALSSATSNKAVRELADVIYTALFETVLDKVASGMTLTDVIKEDQRQIDSGKFRAWLRKDPKRTQRYHEAKAIGAESIEDQMISIADAENNTLEDVQRSNLRINTRWKILAVWDRKRYGTTHTVEVNNKPPMVENHLEDLAERLQKLRQRTDVVYDVESRQVD